MCGIAGTVGSQGVTEQDVRKMIAAIRYRGRDEAGVETKGPAIMGHARLAIVDLENGFQPMSNTDNSVWVIFNGEIYNFVEIRKNLEAKGYKFKSRCDTEVLVHLWTEKGEKLLDDLIGMFSFFIWDTTKKKGILVRDRLGIKPCFIANYKGGIAFCSEIKGLLTLPEFHKSPNRKALLNTFAFNYCPPPQTCFEGVTQLEPGTYLLFEEGKKTTQHKYWERPCFETKNTLRHGEWEDLMRDAIQMQMRFDVEGGLFLSGGIDSSVVGSYLIEQWNKDKLEATALDFKEQGYSEYNHSKKAADILGIKLNPALISWEMIPKVAEKVSWHAEQPHGDFSFFLFYILSKKAHQEGKTVMFTGDGPDESLLGFNHNISFFNEYGSDTFLSEKYFEKICYMDDMMSRRLLDADIIETTEKPLKHFQNMLKPWANLNPIEQVIAYETTYLMPGNNCIKGDRMGACWSIEGRSPYLDHRIVEFFAKLPIEEKFHSGIGKRFLKQQAEKQFPREFLYGKKRMPTTPIGDWFKTVLYNWSKEILASQHHDLFNQNEALKVLDEHKEGIANHTRALRTLLMTSLWASNYFK
jgi:asparagine synthase (glutamine-hydrolysing)